MFLTETKFDDHVTYVLDILGEYIIRAISSIVAQYAIDGRMHDTFMHSLSIGAAMERRGPSYIWIIEIYEDGLSLFCYDNNRVELFRYFALIDPDQLWLTVCGEDSCESFLNIISHYEGRDNAKKYLSVLCAYLQRFTLQVLVGRDTAEIARSRLSKV